MKWVSRAELGWPASAAPEQLTTRGVKIHYEGTAVHCSTHTDCVNLVKAIRRSHLANVQENYSDIAYNLLVCRHGFVFEGRGKYKRTGANGNQPLNQAHYAICGLLGNSGDVNPTPEMITGLKEGISYLRAHGAGKEIKGHRDGYATLCPGAPLYALVTGGKLEPSAPVVAKPTPVYAPFPGATFFRIGRTSKLITAMGKRLVANGYKGYKVGPGPVFTAGDKKAVAWFQRQHAELAGNPDGIPGPLTWKLLKVPKV